MRLLIKALFFLISYKRHYRVVLSHWFWTRHYNGRLILPHYMISDQPLSFVLDSTGRIEMEDAVNFAGTSKLLVQEGGTIHIGKGTFFNRGCSLNALDKIEIGEQCLFGEGVKIYDHNHRFDTKDKLIRDQGYTKAPVIIGNNVWIGSNVVILKGVVIGNHVVVGANCVISKDIPDHNIVTLTSSNLSVKPILLK